MVAGVVKFFTSEQGWGVVVSPDIPGDVWVHFSVIEMGGYRALTAGDVVEMDVEEATQPPFSYRATRVRHVRSGPAPTLRRRGDRVEIVPDGTPETPPTPRRRRRG